MSRPEGQVAGMNINKAEEMSGRVIKEDKTVLYWADLMYNQTFGTS